MCTARITAEFWRYKTYFSILQHSCQSGDLKSIFLEDSAWGVRKGFNSKMLLKREALKRT